MAVCRHLEFASVQLKLYIMGRNMKLIDRKIHMEFELKSLIIRKIYEFYQNLRWRSAAILNLCQHSRITDCDYRYYCEEGTHEILGRYLQ